MKTSHIFSIGLCNLYNAHPKINSFGIMDGKCGLSINSLRWLALKRVRITGSSSLNEGIKLECKFNFQALLRIFKNVAQYHFDSLKPVSQRVVVDVEYLSSLSGVLIMFQECAQS